MLVVSVSAILAWWASILPSNDRNWGDDVSRPALASIEGDTLTVRNVRTFDWRSDTDYTPSWEDRTYDLNTLRGLDLWSSTWAGEDIAHILVSFDFGPDKPPLVWSIELRREKGEEYSAIAGFFKQAELIAIAADERDIIRVRTNVRGETVRLYRLNAGPAATRRVLETYVEQCQPAGCHAALVQYAHHKLHDRGVPDRESRSARHPAGLARPGVRPLR